jgi:hypothetical protein
MPSMFPSTRLPSTEHRVATASPLRAAAPPPMVQAAGLQRAFQGAYVGWSRRSIDSRPAATLPLWGVASCARSSSPSPCTDVPSYRRAASHGSGRHIRARSSSTTYFNYRRCASSRNLHGLCRRWFRRLHLHLRPLRLCRQRHRLFLDKSTPTTTDGFGPSSPLCVSQPLWSLLSKSLDMEQSSYWSRSTHARCWQHRRVPSSPMHPSAWQA